MLFSYNIQSKRSPKAFNSHYFDYKYYGVHFENIMRTTLSSSSFSSALGVNRCNSPAPLIGTPASHPSFMSA